MDFPILTAAQVAHGLRTPLYLFSGPQVRSLGLIYPTGYTTSFVGLVDNFRSHLVWASATCPLTTQHTKHLTQNAQHAIMLEAE